MFCCGFSPALHFSGSYLGRLRRCRTGGTMSVAMPPNVCKLAHIHIEGIAHSNCPLQFLLCAAAVAVVVASLHYIYTHLPASLPACLPVQSTTVIFARPKYPFAGEEVGGSAVSLKCG